MKKIENKIVYVVGLIMCFSIINSFANNELNEIKGYKLWKKVNEKPWKQPPLNARACNIPTSLIGRIETEKGSVENPHIDKYIYVYVNNIGKKAMIEKQVDFPVGSVIVKEKFNEDKADNIELITVMIKREKNYNLEGGDWEYAIFSGKTLSLQSKGKLNQCQSCHLSSKNTGYVFRTYLDN